MKIVMMITVLNEKWIKYEKGLKQYKTWSFKVEEKLTIEMGKNERWKIKRIRYVILSGCRVLYNKYIYNNYYQVKVLKGTSMTINTSVPYKLYSTIDSKKVVFFFLFKDNTTLYKKTIDITWSAILNVGYIIISH